MTLKLQERFYKAIAFPGTLQYHAFQTNNEGQIIAKKTGFSVNYSEYPKKEKVKLIAKKKNPIAKK